jgi:hypothetical protein
MSVTNDGIVTNWQIKKMVMVYRSVERGNLNICGSLITHKLYGWCQGDDELAQRRQSGSIVMNFPSECYGQVNLILRGPLRYSWTAPESGLMRSAMTSLSESRGLDPVGSVILHPESGSRDTENVNILCVITATFSFVASLLIFSLCFLASLTHSLMELSPSWEAANCAAT